MRTKKRNPCRFYATRTISFETALAEQSSDHVGGPPDHPAHEQPGHRDDDQAAQQDGAEERIDGGCEHVCSFSRLSLIIGAVISVLSFV